MVGTDGPCHGPCHSKDCRKRMITNKFGRKVQGIELTKSLLTDKDPIELPESLGVLWKYPKLPALTHYFLPHILVVTFQIGIRADKAPGLVAFVATTCAIGVRSLVVLGLISCDFSYKGTTSVVGCRSRPSSQSKRPTSVSKALCSPSLTSARISVLAFFILGSSLSLRYFSWSATGLSIWN